MHHVIAVNSQIIAGTSMGTLEVQRHQQVPDAHQADVGLLNYLAQDAKLALHCIDNIAVRYACHGSTKLSRPIMGTCSPPVAL